MLSGRRATGSTSRRLRRRCKTPKTKTSKMRNLANLPLSPVRQPDRHLRRLRSRGREYRTPASPRARGSNRRRRGSSSSPPGPVGRRTAAAGGEILAVFCDRAVCCSRARQRPCKSCRVTRECIRDCLFLSADATSRMQERCRYFHKLLPCREHFLGDRSKQRSSSPLTHGRIPILQALRLYR